MKTLAIIGSGNLGQQIAHYALSDKHYSRVVFFDDFSNESQVNGMEIIGKTDSIEKAFSENLFNEIIIGIGYKHLSVKKEMYDNLIRKKLPFARIIHSSCWVDKSATIENGCIIYPGCLIDANAVIKANTVLNIGCTIAHDSTIESHCFLSPRVAVAGFVNVGEQCFLGINSTIIDSISIIEKTRIGGATVVVKSIEKSGLYVGNPAKFLKL
jgi:sugar O-acyltransferase (sialic acid O-acetyltransferase NeuD family)